jgi:hypothetical protein
MQLLQYPVANLIAPSGGHHLQDKVVVINRLVPRSLTLTDKKLAEYDSFLNFHCTIVSVIEL